MARELPRSARAMSKDFEVRIRLNCYDLIAVDIPLHKFTVQFFVEVSWEDGTLVDEPESKLVDVTSWESMFPYIKPLRAHKYWTPRLQFGNVIELTDREEWVRVYTHHNESRTLLPFPVVCYRMRALGTFRERFELQGFPFDAQDLQIVFRSAHEVGSSREHPPLRLVRNSSPQYQAVVPHGHFILRDEYSMALYQGMHSDLSAPQLSSSRRRYPQVTIAMKIVRIPTFYIYSVILPMSVFVGLGFLVLLLDPGQLHDRLSIVLSLLLATVAYKTYLSERIPVCNYLTFLDKYILACLLVMGLLALESAFVFMCSKRFGPSAAREQTEDAIGLGVFGAWMLCHLLWLPRRRTNDDARTQAEADCKLAYTHVAAPASYDPMRHALRFRDQQSAPAADAQQQQQQQQQQQPRPTSDGAWRGLPLSSSFEVDVHEEVPGSAAPRRSSRTRAASATDADATRRAAPEPPSTKRRRCK